MQQKTMSPVEYNKKTLVIVAVGGVILLYVVYAFSPRILSARTTTLHPTWNNKGFGKTFLDIPESIKEDAKKIKIEPRHLSFYVDGQKVEMAYREAEALGKEKFAVLLLHGAAFSSKTWHNLHSKSDPDLNTISLIAASGYKAIAVDLPGHGDTKKQTVKDTAKFLAKMIEALKLTKPVIVSPSYSGSFSLPFLFGSDRNCADKARGFVPVAPGGTEKYEQIFEKCKVLTMIVYGEKDKNLGLHSTNYLRNLANREILPMKNAGHPCYIDFPDEWHYYLYNYLKAVEREEGN